MTNQIIAELPEDCRAALLPRLLTKPIRAGEVLYVEGSPAQSIILPDHGMISLQSRMRDGRMIEKIQVCRDGAAGSEAFLGLPRAQSDAVVLISGVASWLPVQDLIAARAQFPEIDQALFGAFARLLLRTAQTVACASVHPAAQRIAAWLLRADDVTTTGSFDVMQRSLADVLGLRLATVSEACSRLMQIGAIRYSRGLLTILDRNLLLTNACECYEASKLCAA